VLHERLDERAAAGDEDVLTRQLRSREIDAAFVQA